MYIRALLIIEMYCRKCMGWELRGQAQNTNNVHEAREPGVINNF